MLDVIAGDRYEKDGFPIRVEDQKMGAESHKVKHEEGEGIP